MKLLVVFMVEFAIVTCINLLPCTDVVDQQRMARARNIIEASTPPGYTLRDIKPDVTLGRNPHRWIATFRRNDNHYENGCAYLVSTKKYFKRVCPARSEIRTISIRNTPNDNCISVEFLVNCYCENNPRRRRR